MPPGAHLWSIEFSAANAAIARRIWDHAGVGDRVDVIVGTLGDGGETIAALEADHGFAAGSLDFVFIDHEKSAYVADLQRIIEHGWLRRGAVAVADNIRFPGAPKYRAYMREQEGTAWRTTEHDTHLEYQSLMKDLVLESEYLGA
jgi:catechol O-methyltransferase